MKTKTVCYKINQPSVADYHSVYFRMKCNTKNKEILFAIITDKKNITEAIIFADTTGSSPVAFYENKIQEALDSKLIDSLSPHEKQFVGTVTCCVMKSNGWKKLERKQRFSKGIFKSAEIYILNKTRS